MSTVKGCSVADWIEDRLYNTMVVGGTGVFEYPLPTGDPRRWPDVSIAVDRVFDLSDGHNGFNFKLFTSAVMARLGLDADLEAIIKPLFVAYQRNDGASTPDDAWALANAIDAAVDEQDRRDGKPWRGPRPDGIALEPAPAPAPFTVGAAVKIPGAK